METKKNGPDSALAAGSPGAITGATQAAKSKVEDVMAADEYAGKGGSFMFDPETGARTPAAETSAKWAADARLAADKEGEVAQ